MYDVYTPIVADADSVIPYEERQGDGAGGPGSSWARTTPTMLREGFDHRWIDV